MDRWVQQQEMLRNNRFSIPRMSIESSLGRRRGGGWGSAKWIIICTEEWYPQLPLSVNTCARRSVNGYGWQAAFCSSPVACPPVSLPAVCLSVWLCLDEGGELWQGLLLCAVQNYLPVVLSRIESSAEKTFAYHRCVSPSLLSCRTVVYPGWDIQSFRPVVLIVSSAGEVEIKRFIL